MNIQIFGRSKCFDTKKAERWFKERGIKFQSIDLVKKGLSPGEYRAVRQKLKLEELMDTESKTYRALGLDYYTEAGREEKLLENPALFRAPIVRNGKEVSVGYHPEVWEKWA